MWLLNDFEFRLLVKKDNTITYLFLLTFLIALTVSLQMPILSLFMTKIIGVNPLWTGLFFMMYASMGILCSLFFAKRSDTVMCRKKLIQWCCLFGIVGGVFFAFCRDYLLLLGVGTVLTGFASAATPQLFAFAKEHAHLNDERIDVIATLMRASYSLAWVIGPPFAFWVAATHAFSFVFLFIAIIFIVSYFIVVFCLPPDPREKDKIPHLDRHVFKQSNLRWLFLGTTAMWVCNSVYLFTLPLFISKVLVADVRWSGVFLGLASFIEFPIMVCAGLLIVRTGKRVMMLLGAAAGIGFFVSLIWINSITGMLAAQILNAVFIGMLGGVGVSCFMELLPKSPGVAATLFTTSARVGSVIGGGLAGVIAHFFGFEAVFVLAALLTSLAFFACWQVRFTHHEVVMETLS